MPAGIVGMTFVTPLTIGFGIGHGTNYRIDLSLMNTSFPIRLTT